ncbi:MAG: histidine phosphatase family protein [Bradymonadales bacterium]
MKKFIVLLCFLPFLLSCEQDSALSHSATCPPNGEEMQSEQNWLKELQACEEHYECKLQENNAYRCVSTTQCDPDAETPCHEEEHPKDEVLELWLLRHGQTHANANGILAGWLDTELTDLGIEQAKAVRPKLDAISFQAVYSSDLKRTVDTARLAYGEPIQDKRLRETHFGDYEGMYILKIDPLCLWELYTFGDFSAPNGESKSQTRDRVVEFINELAPGRYLVVCHGAVIRILSNELGEDYILDNSEILRVDWTNQKVIEKL